MRLWCVMALAMLGVPALPAGTGLAADTCDGRVATIVGTDGPDTIIGTAGDDVISGRGGNDQIDGGPGADVICGGVGDDILDAGDDGLDNRLLGDEGDDTLLGGQGDDVLYGGDGSDRLYSGGGLHNNLMGERGNDMLQLDQLEESDHYQFVSGGPGWDTLDLRYVWVPGNGQGVWVTLEKPFSYLRRANCPAIGWLCSPSVQRLGEVDTIENVYGSQGNDYLQGDGRPNRLYGLDGRDYLVGRGNSDRLEGGPGRDRLDGGVGDDWLEGGAGSDLLNGGDGTDTCLSGETIGGCEL